MKCIAVEPPRPGVKAVDAPDPTPSKGELLIRTLEVGIDGTDLEIARGEYGEPPRGQGYLVLGHEALGTVERAPLDGRLDEGDLVNPTVRRGCGICVPCNSDHSDFCFTGLFKERGIKGLDGFMSERFVETEEHLVRVPPDLEEYAVLTEPMSIAVKAVEQILKIQERMPWREGSGLQEKRAFVAGSGSLGIMATLLLRIEGAEVVTMDRSPDDSGKAKLIEATGAHHLNVRSFDPLVLAEDVEGFDIVVEATGSAEVPFRLMQAMSRNGIMVLLGVPGTPSRVQVDASDIVRRMVLQNQLLFGSVNSNASHFRAAHRYLRQLLRTYPDEMKGIIRRYPWQEFQRAFEERVDAVKRVLVWGDK